MVEVFDFSKANVGDKLWNPWYGWFDIAIKYDKIIMKQGSYVFEINVNGVCPSFGYDRKFVFAMIREEGNDKNTKGRKHNSLYR